jgi:hypothetical protein
MLVLVTNALVAEIAGCDHAVANLLSKDNVDNTTLAAKIMYECKCGNADFVELAAYILALDFSAPEKVEMNEWLIRVIEQSGDSRYKFLIKKIYGNKRAGDALRKRAKSAYTKLTKESGSRFWWAGYNYSASHEKMLESSSIKAREHINLNEVKRGDTIDVVYKKLGAPSLVSAFVEPGSPTGVADYRVRPKIYSLQLLYKGVGILHLDSVGLYGIYSLLPAYHSFDIVDNVELLHGIYTDQVRVVRQAAKRLLAIETIHVKELDAIAYRAWMGRNETDLYMIDAMTMLCKLLYKTNNPRYRTLFQALVSDSSGVRLQKFAGSVLTRLAAGDLEQFQPELVAVKQADK